MSRSPMTAKRGAELMLDFLDGTLDVDLAQELQAFISNNPEFRSFVASYEATIRCVKNALTQDVPQDAEERTLVFLRSQQSSSKVG